MNKNICILILIVMIIPINGCYIGHPCTGERTILNKNNIKELNGSYKGLYTDDASMWNLLKMRFTSSKYIDSKNMYVDVEFRNKRKTIFKLMDHGKQIKKKTIRGRIKNGYFYVQPKFLIAPFFIWIYYEYSHLRISKAGELLRIESRWGYGAFFFIAGKSDAGKNSCLYKKVECNIGNKMIISPEDVIKNE